MKKSNYDDFIGRKLGEVKVLKNVGKKYNWVYYYLCECLLCGERREISGSQLRRGSKNSHPFCTAKITKITCKGCGKNVDSPKKPYLKKFCSGICLRKNYKSIVTHGTRSKYNFGCRCHLCTKANTIAHRKYILFKKK